MSTPTRLIRARFPRVAVAAAMLVTWPLVGFAQSVPASSSTSSSMAMGAMPGMDHASMPGMTMPAASTTVATPAAAVSHQHKAGRKPAARSKPAGHMHGMDHSDMPGMHSSSMPEMNKPAATVIPAAKQAKMPPMSHAAMPGMAPAAVKDSDHALMPGMDHAAMSSMDHAGMDHAPMAGMTDGSPAPQDSMSGMNMGAMQGGSPPPDARSPDYSDGVGYGPMMPHMHSSTAVGMLLLDQLETVHGRDGNGQAWEVQAWYGVDEDKLWLRSEGDVSTGRVEDGNIEALWNHAIATYWGSQLGVRHDFGAGPSRDWVAFGVQGVAPYWFGLEATGYVGSAGRTAARLRADYEVLFNQRLILQPELEFNLYGKDDPARGIGSGLSDVQFGLRLRYEIRREFAPYVGINWVCRVGTSAGYARADGQPVFDQQLVAGFRIWF